LCFGVSATCAVMLLRGWRTSRVRLLLWSGIGFSGIALNNLLLVVGENAGRDWSAWRGAPALAGLIVMIWGLIEERSR
ncbi:MAG TPA: DUF5985 family protein, partial [Thermoanaerobaculia bacterium]